MDKEDARFQKLEQLHERRKQVVRLHLRGTGVMQIVTLTGLSYPTVRKAVDLFEAGGWPAIKPAARGRSAGDGRLLSADQEAAVRRTICDKRPEQLKMEFALWTRGAVMQYIEREFGVKLSIRATGVLVTVRGGERFPCALPACQVLSAVTASVRFAWRRALRPWSHRPRLVIF